MDCFCAGEKSQVHRKLCCSRIWHQRWKTTVFKSDFIFYFGTDYGTHVSVNDEIVQYRRSGCFRRRDDEKRRRLRCCSEKA